MPLDRHAILHTALQFVDREGLDALSMRKLGALLGVEAMTLYYYIPGKRALLDGLAEVVLEQLELPTGIVEDWQTAVRESARSFRRVGLQHPNVFPLLATVGLDNPASYRPTDAILEFLGAAGFDQALAFTAFTTTKSFVVGHVLWMIGERLVGGGHFTPATESFPAERYPRLASYLPYLAECDEDEEFERGLDLIVAALETQLAARTSYELNEMGDAPRAAHL